MRLGFVTDFPVSHSMWDYDEFLMHGIDFSGTIIASIVLYSYGYTGSLIFLRSWVCPPLGNVLSVILVCRPFGFSSGMCHFWSLFIPFFHFILVAAWWLCAQPSCLAARRQWFLILPELRPHGVGLTLVCAHA